MELLSKRYFRCFGGNTDESEEKSIKEREGKKRMKERDNAKKCMIEREKKKQRKSHASNTTKNTLCIYSVRRCSQKVMRSNFQLILI